MVQPQAQRTWWRKERSLVFSARRLAAGLAMLVAAGVVFGGLVYVNRDRIFTGIGRQLVVDDPVEPADAIVVLSGDTPGRELEALDLYKAGVAPRILLPHDPERTGYYLARRRGIPIEGDLDLGQRIFRTGGVPEDAVIVLEPVVQSTIQEAEVVAAWAAAHGLHRLLVVTSMFHTGRAAFVYRRVLKGTNLSVRLRGARADTFRPETWWRSRTELRNGLFEWEKMIWYRLRY